MSGLELRAQKQFFVLSPSGKLQVKWDNPQEKKLLLKIVKSLFVLKHGQELRINPTGQQTFVSYPPPKKFKLYWCNEETIYAKEENRKC